MPSLFPVTEIIHESDKYIKNKQIIILCELTCSSTIESEAVIYETGQKTRADANSAHSQRTLKQDIRTLFSDKSTSDVQMKVGEEILQAHRSILSARSPVFRAMFKPDMVEGKAEIVEIKDVNTEAFKSLINYIYCDEIDQLDYEKAKNLLIVADLYEVLRLKDMCASILMSEITDKNAVEIVSLAETYSHNGLKLFAIDFIADHSDTILFSPEWFPFISNHLETATAIFQKLTKNKILD
nr:speckle-type POZ protein B-like [Parasteatoda tepidariorum]